MENERMTFKIIDENGREIDCEALFTFESEETNRNYMVYTDNTTDEEGNVKVYAAIYEPENKEGLLQPIETEKEWKIIETILDEIQNDIKQNITEESGE